MSKETQLYEISVLVNPEIPEEKAPEVLGSIRAVIEDNGGMIDGIQDLKMRRLWYPVKKMTQAYFGAIQFIVSPSKIAVIRKEVEKNTSILRHLLMEWKKEPARPIIRPALDKPEEAVGEIAMPTEMIVPSNDVVEKEKDKPRINEEEIDKKLDEILGS